VETYILVTHAWTRPFTSQWLIISVCKSQLQITTLFTQSITGLLAGNIQLKTFREYNYHLFTLQIIRT